MYNENNLGLLVDRCSQNNMILGLDPFSNVFINARVGIGRH